jgi:hypothetical protein
MQATAPQINGKEKNGTRRGIIREILEGFMLSG